MFGLNLENHFAKLGDGFFTQQSAEKVAVRPQLLHANASAASLIDLDPAIFADPRFAAAMAGNIPLEGFAPLATVYSGHQFGVWAGQLGDGRALLIGQVRNARGDLWDIQLKGAGRTLYSRSADGRAVLRSSIREYLCGEAMHALGIPTSRALSLVATGETVMREAPEPGAVIARLAPSHVRFGHFEHFHYAGKAEMVRALLDHVIAAHFPGLSDAEFFGEAVRRTAVMVAQWQAVGFAHGVMNTDNMSILGLTLDYGPFGFMDGYDPHFICNHTDSQGRYSVINQPGVAHWNLRALAAALSRVVPAEALVAELKNFEHYFATQYRLLLRAKLGLVRDGELVATAAVHLGGRLLVVDPVGCITRLDPAGRRLALRAGFDWQVGSLVQPGQLQLLADSMADALVRVLRHQCGLRDVTELLLTDPLPAVSDIDGLMFSGGVGEYVYHRESRDFGDLGKLFGEALRLRLDAGALPWALLPAGECLRATVLGASEYSVQLSGNTTFVSNPGVLLPRKNLQVVPLAFALPERIESAEVARALTRSFLRHDLREGEQDNAISLRWSGTPNYARLAALADGLLAALPRSLAAGRALYLVADGDIAQTLGHLLQEDPRVRGEVLVIDGVTLWGFDFIDLGRIRMPSRTVPVTIKSLVFSEDPRAHGKSDPAHAQGHRHEHDHSHAHGHDHGHSHSHGHDPSHGHDHGHPHSHDHGHTA